MSDGTPTPIPASQEITQNYRPGAAPPVPGNPWKTIALFLGMIVTGGTVISVVGKAFYVTRAEYTEKAQKDMVEQSTLRQTLENVSTSLNNQRAEFKNLSEVVYNLKYELAKEGSRASR
jgi:hypothetical protein